MSRRWRTLFAGLLAMVCLDCGMARGQNSEGNRLLDQGRAALEGNRPEEARESLEKALDTFRTNEDHAGEAAALKELGIALYRLERYSEAIGAQRDGLELARSLGDRRLEARLLNNLGLALQARGDAEAPELFEESLGVAHAVGDVEIEIIALGNAAGVALQGGDHDTARELLERSLAAARRLDSSRLEAPVHVSLAQVAEARNDNASAILHFRKAVAGFRKLGIGDAEAGVLSSLGMAYLEAGMASRAITSFEASLELAREQGLSHLESAALQGLLVAMRTRALDWPSAENIRGQTEVAEELLDLAHRTHDEALTRKIEAQLEELEELEDPRLDEEDFAAPAPHRKEGLALRQLGWTLSERGDIAGALELCSESLELAREHDDHEQEALALEALGSLHMLVGQPDRAEGSYLEMQQLADRRDDGRLRLQSRLLVGLAQLMAGHAEKAGTTLDESLAAIQPDDSGLEAEIRYWLGHAALAQGDHRRAIGYWERQLELVRAFDDETSSPGAPTVRELVASLRDEAEAQGLDPERAEALLTGDPTMGRLLRSYHRLDSKAEEARREVLRTTSLEESAILANLATAYASLGETDTALELAEESSRIAAGTGEARDRATAHEVLGYVFFRKAQSAETTSERESHLGTAQSHLRDATEEYDGLLRALRDAEDFKISAQDVFTVSHEVLQRVLIEQKKFGEALETAERARARALVDAVARRPGRATEELRSTPTLAEMFSLARESETTLVIYSLLYGGAGLLPPGRFGGARPELEETLLIWVVRPEGELYMEEVDLSALRRRPRRSSLTRLVTESREGLTRGGRGVRPEALARGEEALTELSALLVSPIAERLSWDEEDARVVFVPQGMLFLVPFAALAGPDGEPLVSHFTLSTAPSIGVLLALQGRPIPESWSPEDVLVVGDPKMPPALGLPELPGARREAQAVARRFDARPLISAEATQSAVVQAMATSKLIHLATHGLFDHRDTQIPRGLPGALVFASETGDGLLSAGELADMALMADLVVLSACDTGLGRLTGDGVVGLARAFLTAGAGRVVVSLWQVEDEATTFLMQQFYDLLDETRDEAVALRHAMLRTKEKYERVGQWAGFSSIGALRKPRP